MKLTIGMIVKNEEKFLPETLKAAKVLLDNIESELIIADTGSTDRSIEIIKGYTDNFFEIPWRDDFAWARNQVLDKAKGEWHLHLDADEIIQKPESIIDFFNSDEYKNYNGASILLINKGNELTNQKLQRLTNLKKSPRFEGKIHEFLQAEAPIKKLDTVFFHLGYHSETEEEAIELKKKKSNRNLPPLIKMHEENPNDLRIIAHLSMEYLVARDFDLALEYADMGLKKAAKSKIYTKRHKELFEQTFLFRKAEAYRAMNDYDVLANFVNILDKQKEVFASHYLMRVAQGISLSKLSRYDEAAIAFEKAYSITEMGMDGKLDRELEHFVSLPPFSREQLLATADHIIISHLKNHDIAGAVEWGIKNEKPTDELISLCKNEVFDEDKLAEYLQKNDYFEREVNLKKLRITVTLLEKILPDGNEFFVRTKHSYLSKIYKEKYLINLGK